MMGNRVRVILVADPLGPGRPSQEGTLQRLDEAGIILHREHSLPEGRGNVFIPMHRIYEIVDLGRVP